MLINDDDGLHDNWKQINNNLKDNIYPDTIGKVLSFFYFCN